jgi:hypothetical protein
VPVMDMLRFEQMATAPRRSRSSVRGDGRGREPAARDLALPPGEGRAPPIPRCCSPRAPTIRASEPWQPGKMAARLQAASTSGKPVLLRMNEPPGRGTPSAREELRRHLRLPALADGRPAVPAACHPALSVTPAQAGAQSPDDFVRPPRARASAPLAILVAPSGRSKHMLLTILVLIACAVVATAGVPLMLKIVPPNPYYGYPTRHHHSKPERWVQVNVFAGRCLVGAAARSRCCCCSSTTAPGCARAGHSCSPSSSRSAPRWGHVPVRAQVRLTLSPRV